MPDCIEAVERAFLRHARGETIPPGVLGAHVEGGGFHVKSAGLLDAVDGRPVFAAKVNANFPGNPDRTGLPTIQGVIALFDAANGRLLALLDSIEITSLRTAAATAVAAKYLAPDSAIVTICGCGEQAEPAPRAGVRPYVTAGHGAGPERRAREAICRRHDRRAGRGRHRHPRSGRGRARHEHLGDVHSLAPVVPRSRARRGRRLRGRGRRRQSREAGDRAGAARPQRGRGGRTRAVRRRSATCITRSRPGSWVARTFAPSWPTSCPDGSPGRLSPDEIIVFDSTGTALQDVAAAALVYERARASGAGLMVDLGGGERHA